MNIKPYDKTIKDLLGSKHQFVIPRFQRDYSWDKKHYQEFLEDLIENFKIKDFERKITETQKKVEAKKEELKQKKKEITQLRKQNQEISAKITDYKKQLGLLNNNTSKVLEFLPK